MFMTESGNVPLGYFIGFSVFLQLVKQKEMRKILNPVIIKPAYNDFFMLMDFEECINTNISL
jgi:hypothetical protein